MTKRKWTKQKIIDELRKFSKSVGGKTPTEKYFAKKGNYGLYKAAKRYFGSYTKAVLAAGLKPNLQYWNKEKILLEFKKIVSKLGHVPTYRDLIRMKRYDILSAIRRHYDNQYNDVVRDCGFQPNNIRWNKDKVKQGMIDLSQSLCHTPTERELKLHACDLLGGAVRVFGSLNNAVKHAGLYPNQSFVESDFWKAWEQFIISVATKLHDGEVVPHFRLPNNKIPDVFVKKSKLVIEAKLNVSSEALMIDVKNYQNYANVIEFWYLYGTPLIFGQNIKFIGPNDIEKLLKRVRDKSLLRDLHLLKKGINPNGLIRLDNIKR